MKKILVVEDNNEINDLLNKILSNKGYRVVGAFSGTEALMYVKNEAWDTILLDLMLPGISGEELIVKIREITETPIIVISAKSDKNTKLSLLDNGADDFIEKPFDCDEVIARVNSNLRRYLEFSGLKEEHNVILTYKDITLNRETIEVKVKGRDVKLRLKEFQILELFMMNPSKIFSKSNLYESLWKETYLGEDNLVVVHLSRLRNKLAVKMGEDCIENIWGVGYRLKKNI